MGSFLDNEVARNVHEVAVAVHCCSLVAAVGQRRSFQVAAGMRREGVRTCQDDMERDEGGRSRVSAHKRGVVEAYALGLVVLPMGCSSEAVCCMVAEEGLEHIQVIPWDLV